MCVNGTRNGIMMLKRDPALFELAIATWALKFISPAMQP